jgi:DMSO/TMAO reductase YedYZ molybdopterin-dependent catalytic subunit
LNDIKSRTPPGQYLVSKMSVLHEGDIPKIDIDSWLLKLFGLVEKEISIDFSTFTKLPQKRITADFHCVEKWSKLDVIWEGVQSLEIIKLVKIKPEAKFVMIHSYGGYSTNISLNDFLSNDVLFATKLNDKTLALEYGFPVRLVVPKLYAWKSAKWVSGVEFIAKDIPGYWESRGYHMRGDPWNEERFGSL